MGLFKKKRQIDHPKFGSLTFEESGFWTGSECPFAPAGTITVHITAGPEGPSAEQERFLEELTRKYPSIRPAIAEALAEECDVPVDAVWVQFALEHLAILPHAPDRPQSWQVVFARESSPDLFFTAEMEGDRPSFIVVDG